ncbi:hypothetical protein [Thiomonas delicata]|uniref:Uncharacterized protein n=1 Tax=Thiomonas delicata TaxID=364030 RepID=A0A238D9I5_THIDL|nr:hypothetical protein [Thiomonas delicata]SBP89784.1 hypothetical protein THIARS_80308 [Thiomonas delicata]
MLDSIYSDYDVDLRSAVEAAYAKDVVNPDTTLEDFYAVGADADLSQAPDLR